MQKAGKVKPDPVPLPPDRIHRVAAFQITGAYLAGPLSLRGGSKAWIVLFTCAVYRAVHLDLVSSLSTESFIQALRRFWARRGRGSTLYNDNGTNFVGAANAVKSLDWDFTQS
ncbi:integrase catalytic domain-containing protein [Trichonephila clavipes]|nr:integrase catalytic domain-containing protein [Trichonephila clavipes]